MSRVRPFAVTAALVLAAAGVAYATYGDPPTQQEIRNAEGPISSITEINRNSDTGPRGLIYASEKPHELFMHISIVGLATPGEQLKLAYTRGRCAQDPGRKFAAYKTAIEGDFIHFRGVVPTSVDALSKSVTLRTRALRMTVGGEQVGCGPVVVLRLTNEDPNP